MIFIRPRLLRRGRQGISTECGDHLLQAPLAFRPFVIEDAKNDRIGRTAIIPQRKPAKNALLHRANCSYRLLGPDILAGNLEVHPRKTKDVENIFQQQ